MKVVDIERVIILMRFIQFGWDEERKKAFDDDLRHMLETQCEDLDKHKAQIRADAIEEFVEQITLPITTEEQINQILEQLKEQK